MCMCFQQMNWDMNTSKDFTTCHTSIDKCCRKVCLSFSLVCLSGLCWILIFQPNFVSFWIFLNLLVSVNIHVTKTFTWKVDRWKVNIMKGFMNLLVKSGPRDLNRQNEPKIRWKSQQRITSPCAVAASIKKARIVSAFTPLNKVS